jgi:hypothetical protein
MALSATLIEQVFDHVYAQMTAAQVSARIGGVEVSGLRPNKRHNPLQTAYGVEPGDQSILYVKTDDIAPDGITDGDRFEILESETWTEYRAETTTEYGGAVTAITYRTTSAT